jgi:hypothetical protein
MNPDGYKPMTRRKIFRDSAALLIRAPAVVRATSLMPVRIAFTVWESIPGLSNVYIFTRSTVTFELAKLRS